MTSKNIIQVRNLVKTFTMGDIKVQALRGVNLDIAQGDFVAVMGSSGSGKSTFMNIVGCLDTATSGEYLLDSQNVSTLSRDALASLRNKKIGFVFQSFNLLARTSALENVELPLLYNSSVNAKDRKEKAVNALGLVGLKERLHHMPNQLSGGQQQRVAIARALVNDPVMILADEPTGNLDTKTSYEIMDIFQQMHAKGITVVLVTHEPDIALCTNRNIVFRDGQILKELVVENKKSAAEELKLLAAKQQNTDV